MATAQQLISRTPLLLRLLLVYAVIVVGVWGVSLLPSPSLQPVSLPEYMPPTVIGQPRYVVTGEPVRLVVDRLSVDLPVKPGSYDALTGEWTLSEMDAYFATMTDKPNDGRGSTFIYGHNRRSVFAPLADITTGDTVRIMTDNGHTFIYGYSHDAIIKPDMTSVLYEDPINPQLILMTCEGVFSAARRVMYFQLLEVQT